MVYHKSASGQGPNSEEVQGLRRRSFKLLQDDRLLAHHKHLRIPHQEVPKLLHVLAGDVAHLGGRLRAVAQ
ncbi:hypothetical protein E2C01_030058 [Portunus trituberculatus]|uniref:Uncharacterized protein n=1 Tax=Portunus trituberculatus TaxID=210409 RepID=A0A5B7ET72_PORTR|nr:hypothetical protein [Portunus trituberculatus]